MTPSENETAVERRLEAVMNLISASAELIDKQVQRAESLRGRGEPALEAAHTLEVMIDAQVAQMMYRDMLLKTLREGAH